MKQRVLNLLNIKVSESKYVFDLLSVQIFVGIANAYVNIIAFTFFLQSLSIHLLPVAYITIAVLLLLMNVAYEKLEHKLSPLVLIQRIIAFSIPVLLVLWLGLYFGDQKIFIFALLVCSSLFYMVTGYAYWGLVSQLFNIRESKRVFSIVGAGDIPSKLIGYLSAPLLIPFIGLTNLLWLAIASLSIGHLVYSKAIKGQKWDRIKQAAQHDTHEVENKNEKNSIIDFFTNNELIFAISLLSLLSYNVFNFVDFTFLSQVKKKYEDAASLAAFIAVFFAVGRVFALIFKLILSSRAIERLGIITCLFVTPAALFLFSLVFFVLGDKDEYILYIFGIMVLFAEVLRSAMQEPVFFILFQPLKEKLRLKGHLIAKGYMLPPSLIIVGVSLLVLHKLNIEDTILLTIKILLLNLLAWVMVIFYIRKTYLKTLHTSIQKGVFNSEEVYLYDEATIKILINKIEGGSATEIIYALKLLGKAGYKDLSTLLHGQLQSKYKEVKLYVLDKLQNDPSIHLNELKRLMEEETDADIRQQAASIICKVDPAYLSELANNITTLEYSIRKVVIVNLLNQNEFNHLYIAGNELNNLIQSPLVAERMLAVSIIGNLKNVRFTKAIEDLVNDTDVDVKRKAIMVACKLNVHQLLPRIINMLDNPSEKYLALQGLLKFGDRLFVHLRDLEKDKANKFQSEFIRLAGQMKGEHSTGYLLEGLNNASAPVSNIVHSLWKKDYTPVGVDVHRMRSLLDQYFLISKMKLEYFDAIPVIKSQELVKNSIQEEIKNSLVTSLQLSGMLYNRPQVSRVLEIIEFADAARLFNAMEMMEMVLPKKVSKELNVLFDHIHDAAESHSTSNSKEMAALYANIVFTFEKEFSSWTKAVCIYNSWLNQEIDIINELRSRPIVQHPLIMWETTNYVLNDQK